MKAIATRVQHEFQEFGRRRLGSWIVQDLDAYGRSAGNLYFPDDDTHSTLVSETSFAPRVLLEIKRSSIEPERWRPFAEDRANYAALVELGRRAGIPVLVVYHLKGRPIDDDDLLHVFLMREAWPEYRGRRKLMTASAFADAFPDVFSENA